MATLLEKVQILISANLHQLVDQALQSNSIAVYNYYVREIETNLDKLEDAVATVGGQVKTIQRKHGEYQAQADKLDRDIDLLLADGKESLAAAAQGKLNATRKTAEEYGVQLQQLEREYESLRNARLKLEAKLSTVKQEKEQLQALLDLAKAKEISAQTMRNLDNLAGSRDEDVARVAEGIRQRLDKASAETEMLASSLDAQLDDALDRQQIDDQLAERKRRLGLAEG